MCSGLDFSQSDPKYLSPAPPLDLQQIRESWAWVKRGDSDGADWEETYSICLFDKNVL